MGISKIKTLIVSTLILGVSSSFAMTDSELTIKMRKEVEPYLIKIKSPKLIFHWVDASDITPKGKYNQIFSTNDPYFKSYVDKQGSKIIRQRSSNDGDIAGPGLYMASDPLVSRAYGGKKTYGLIVGVIKPEAKLIVDNYYSRPELSAEVRTEFEKRGCAVSDYIHMLDTAEPNCTKLKQLLIGKDISFIDGRVYRWGTVDLPGCSDGRQYIDDFKPINSKDLVLSDMDTFVAYSSKMFSDVYGFTHMTKSGSDLLSNNIFSYLKGLNKVKNSSILSLVSEEQLKDSSIKEMSVKEVEAFSRKYIVNCK